MQYAVYLHAWRTQGASVASVCVTRREGKNRGNKLALLLTVHQVPGAIILPAEGLDAEAGDGLRGVSTHLNKGCVIFNMSVCFVLLFSTPHMLIAAHVGTHLVFVSAAKILAVIPAISLYNISSILVHNNTTSEDIRMWQWLQ